MNNQPSFLTKSISTPAAIVLILVIAIIAGVAIAWQSGWLPEAETPEEEAAEEPAAEAPEEAKTPYIKVIAPNGGEVWKLGNTYTVKWQSSGVDKVLIGLTDYRAAETCLLNNRQSVPAADGQFTFKVSDYHCYPGAGGWELVSITAGDMYKIYVQDADVQTQIRHSKDYFSIVE